MDFKHCKCEFTIFFCKERPSSGFYKHYMVGSIPTKVHKERCVLYSLCCVRLSCRHPGLIQYRVEDCCCAPHLSLEGIQREPCSQCHLPYPCSKLGWLWKRGYFSLSNVSVRIQGSACCLGEAFSLLLKVLNPTLLLTGWRKHHPPTVWVSKVI